MVEIYNFLENCSIDNFDGVGDTDCNVVVISTQAVVAPKKKKNTSKFLVH